MGGGEILRGYLTEASVMRRLAYYTTESDVFTGSANGSVTLLSIQARQNRHVLVTGLCVMRTLNPSNASTPNIVADWPGDINIFEIGSSKLANKGIVKSGNIGGFGNAGWTWPDYIYLKPTENLAIEIRTTNTNEQRFQAVFICEEFQIP